MKDRDIFGEDNRTCRETESPVLQPYVITHTQHQLASLFKSDPRYGGLTLCNPPAYARLWVGEPWMVRPYDSLSHMEVYQRPTGWSPKYPFLSRATTRAFDVPTSCIVTISLATIAPCVGLFSSAEACSFQTKARKDRPTHRHYHLIDRDTIAGYLFRFRPVIPPSVPSFLPLSVFFLCSYFLCSYTVLPILISGFFVSTS